MRCHLGLILGVVSFGSGLASAGVTVAFNPMVPEIGPFPTDFLTVADPAQKTGLRVNLPLTNCQAEPSTCSEIGLINQLDGFNLRPRLRVRFSGAINPDTLRDGVFVLWLEKLTEDEAGLLPPGSLTPINQVLYDPKTNTAFAKPDQILAQTRRYALLITDKVRDADGRPVEADDGFQACLALKVGGGYCEQLARAVRSIESKLAPARIVGGSVFTSLSATAWMEKARIELRKTNVDVKRAAARSAFNVAEIQSISVKLQAKATPVEFAESALPLEALAGVGRIAFGSYKSPFALDNVLMIPATPTAGPVTLPAAAQEIQFEVFLPATPAPPTGYPVVMIGHPMPTNRWGLPVAMAATLAARGFASIAINVLGHGLGPDGKVVVTDKSGQVTELPAGGRSIDVNGDGAYTESEGCLSGLGIRDCIRQNALDHLQLVRAIQSGIDVDGDGTVDLDAGRIYYAGVSIGGATGTLIHSLEPAIQAAVLNGTPDEVWSGAHWAGAQFRPTFIAMLAMHRPPLLNKGTDYDTDYVLRYQPAKVIRAPGAVELQEYLERMEWICMPGAPVAFAPHLWWTTLPGVPMKRTLIQFAHGDPIAAAANYSQVALAANLREMTSVYHHDLARTLVPALADMNAHYYLFPMGSPAEMTIALAGQQQIAAFLASDAWAVPDVNAMLRRVFGKDLFETPALLPEDFGW